MAAASSSNGSPAQAAASPDHRPVPGRRTQPFVHGFAGNEKANVTPEELEALKTWAAAFLGLDAEALKKASAVGEIAEVTNDGEDGRQG